MKRGSVQHWLAAIFFLIVVVVVCLLWISGLFAAVWFTLKYLGENGMLPGIIGIIALVFAGKFSFEAIEAHGWPWKRDDTKTKENDTCQTKDQ